jgi:hypothetical protein
VTPSPSFYSEKIGGGGFSLSTILNISLSFDGCKQKEVKTILLRSTELKIKHLKYNSRHFQKYN